MKNLLCCTILLTACFVLRAQNVYKTYHDSLHGFSFNYPAVWQFKISPQPTFYVFCVPATAGEMSKYADCFDSAVFYLGIFTGPLDSTLLLDGYKKTGSTYLAHDSLNDTVKTFAMAGAGWAGIYHNNVCRIACKGNGVHTGAGTCQFLYFSNGTQTICMQTTGRELDKDVFEKIKTSFQFF